MGAMGIIAGIDSGSTSTRVLLVDLEGTVLIQGEVPVTMPYVIGVDAEAQTLNNILNNFVEKVGNLEMVRIAVLCVTGVTPRLVEAIKIGSKIHRMEVLGDQRNALEGALAGKPGVVVYSGTGSFVIGKNSKNEICRAGGKGFIFSDEGSGYYIGREALRAGLMDFDGRGETTILTREVLKYFQVKDFDELSRTIYSKPIVPSEIARLAPVVFEAAKKKDAVALRIIEEAAKELVRMAKAVSVRLGILEQPFTISFSGNIFRALIMGENFSKILSTKIPSANLVQPRFPPSVGSVIIGFNSLGVKVSDRILKNIEKGLTSSEDKSGVCS